MNEYVKQYNALNEQSIKPLFNNEIKWARSFTYRPQQITAVRNPTVTDKKESYASVNINFVYVSASNQFVAEERAVLFSKNADGK